MRDYVRGNEVRTTYVHVSKELGHVLQKAAGGRKTKAGDCGNNAPENGKMRPDSRQSIFLIHSPAGGI